MQGMQEITHLPKVLNMLTQQELNTIQDYLKWRIEKPECTECLTIYGERAKEPPCSACQVILPEKLQNYITMYNLCITNMTINDMMDIHSIVLELQNKRLFNPKLQ